MVYVMKWKKKNRVYTGSKTYRSKAVAQKKAKFMRQMDDDLPKNQREKWLKTVRVIKKPPKR